jgi:hypothetical protein
MMVRGQIEAPAKSFIEFETNGTKAGRHQITLYVQKVRAGVFSTPSAVLFGNVPIGKKAVQTVYILDAALEPRDIEQVVTGDPDSISVRLREYDRERDAKIPVGANVIGVVDVELNTTNPKKVSSFFSVHLRRGYTKAEKIQVIGNVQSQLMTIPAAIILPTLNRAKANSTAECRCELRTEEPFRLTVKQCPPGLVVHYDSAEHKAHTIRFSLTTAGISAGRYLILLSTRSATTDHMLEVPFYVRNDP